MTQHKAKRQASRKAKPARKAKLKPNRKPTNTTASNADCPLNAVRMHCKLDESCQDRDLVWTVLKDADALDRGRFGVPKKPGGCDPSLLRTDVLKTDAQYGNISWMASYVASMTRYTPVGQTPCADFCNALCEGVKAYQKGV